MTDELLPHYDRELSYLRKLGAEFAAAHPKVAGRLRLSAETIEDPHVSRLVESVAFLNARIRRKLDDEFPELTEALLGALYPHYLAPIPSLAIVQFECERELDKSFTVPAGTQLVTDRMHGEPCSFRSAYKVETWPIDVAQARLVSAPFDAPRTARSKTAAAVLQIELAPKNPKQKFSVLAPRDLRFYLHGAPQHTHLLYELILHDALEVAISAAPNDPQPALLGAEALKPVGFGAHEGLLPYPPQSFLGYRLLTEFFVFPAKFLFFDLTQLPPAKLAQLGSKLWINIYLRRSNSDVEQNVSAATFALGCTPVVNLFKKRAEPIIVDATVPEHHVVPDARRGLAHEVYSIDRVTALLPGDREQTCLPFFGLDRHANDDERAVWWSAARRSAPSTEGAKDDGTELWLTLVDHGVLEGEKEVRLAVETTCMNRDMPNRLPFGGDQPRMAFAEGGGPVKRIRVLTAPTPTRRPARSDEGLWKLVSHLSLNHLSLTGGPDAKVALREILRLYDPTGAAEIKSLLDGITEVSSKPAVLRALDKGQPWLGRGTQVTIKLDSQRFGGMGLYLFASVLDHFLGLYCALNSFVQLVVVPSDRDGELRWPPRAGNKPLL